MKLQTIWNFCLSYYKCLRQKKNRARCSSVVFLSYCFLLVLLSTVTQRFHFIVPLSTASLSYRKLSWTTHPVKRCGVRTAIKRTHVRLIQRGGPKSFRSSGIRCCVRGYLYPAVFGNVLFLLEFLTLEDEITTLSRKPGSVYPVLHRHHSRKTGTPSSQLRKSKN